LDGIFREGNGVAATFRFGDWELDVNAYELRRQGRRVKIERIPLDLLILLLERRGDLVSRDEIVSRLWGNKTFLDAESGVNTAIRKVRQALRESPSRPVFIQTVSGKGYRFCAPLVTSSEEANSTELRPEVSVPPRILPAEAPVEIAEGLLPSPPKIGASLWRRKRTSAGMVAVGCLLLPAIFLSVRLLPKSHQSPPVMLALLPFENLTGDADQEYFADGLSEETIAVLGKLNPERMTVIARTSTMAYKRRTTTAGQIGRELGADYLVEGSVRRERESSGERKTHPRSRPIANLE
jgi:DNA-binding winged helix-turn-helix (wHTH) protein